MRGKPSSSGSNSRSGRGRSLLLAIGVRVVHGWSWPRTLGSLVAALALLAAIVGVVALI